jgi:hypothetical protein
VPDSNAIIADVTSAIVVAGLITLLMKRIIAAARAGKALVDELGLFKKVDFVAFCRRCSHL